MKKYLILFISLLFTFFNVSADDFDVSSTITSPINGNLGGGYYTGLEIYNTGAQSTYSVLTRYNGRLSRIRFNVPIPNNWPDGNCFSTGDLTYRLTLNMATEDWRNYFTTPFISNSSSGTNWATSNVVYVSMKKIYFDFKIPNHSTCDTFLYVDLKSNNVSSIAFTGVSNWNLSSVILSANFPTGSGSGGSGSGGSGATNQDIINNNNQNTQDIINNNNQNTNDIIENNNQTTNDIIDNLTTCSPSKNLFNKNAVTSGIYVTNSGTYVQNSQWSLSTYIPVVPGQKYTISGTTITGGEPISLAFYNSGQDVILGTILHNDYTPPKTITIPNNVYYVRDSIYNGDLSTYQFEKGINATSYVPFGDVCTNKIDDTNKAINELNDTITNSNIDSDLGNGFFDDFESNDFGFSDIIKIPLTYINQLTSSSCVELSIPIPFTNRYINLPCMTSIYQTYIPTIFNIWQVVSFGIISYFIVLDLFRIVKGFKDPDSDKVEVLDL